jgi:hypothetical protein
VECSQLELTYQIFDRSTGLCCGDTGLSVHRQVDVVAYSHYLISTVFAGLISRLTELIFDVNAVI